MNNRDQLTGVEAAQADHIRELIKKYPSSARENLFQDQCKKAAYEKVWNEEYWLRALNETGAGMVGDYFKEALPKSKDEFATYYVSQKYKAQHVFKSAHHFANKNLPFLGDGLTAFESGVLAALHYLCDRSFDGFSHEMKLMQYVNRNFPHDYMRYATGAEDKKYGGDLLYVSGESSAWVQVKPVSFFLANTSGVKRDRQRAFQKLERTEDAGTPVSFHIYPKRGFDFSPYGVSKSPLFWTLAEAKQLVGDQMKFRDAHLIPPFFPRTADY